MLPSPSPGALMQPIITDNSSAHHVSMDDETDKIIAICEMIQNAKVYDGKEYRHFRFFIAFFMMLCILFVNEMLIVNIKFYASWSWLAFFMPGIFLSVFILGYWVSLSIRPSTAYMTGRISRKMNVNMSAIWKRKSEQYFQYWLGYRNFMTT